MLLCCVARCLPHSRATLICLSCCRRFVLLTTLTNKTVCPCRCPSDHYSQSRVAFCNLLIILHACDLLLQTLNMPSDMHQLRQAAKQACICVGAHWRCCQHRCCMPPPSSPLVYLFIELEIHWKGPPRPSNRLASQNGAKSQFACRGASLQHRARN